MLHKENVSAHLKALGLLVLFVLLSAWLFYLPYKIVRQNTIDSLNAQQLLLASQAARGIEEFFKSYDKLLEHLVEHDDIIDLDASGKKLIDTFFNDNKDTLSAVTRIGPSGRILFSVPFREEAIGVDVSNQEHNRLIMDTHEPVVSSVFKAVQGFETVAYAVPVFDGDRYAGCLSILIPFEVVAEKYVANIVLGKDGYAWMISREGIELYCPVPGHTGRTVFQTSSQFPTVIDMAEKMMVGGQGETTYIYDRVKGETVESITKQAVYHPVQLPHNMWSIVVATPEKQALAAVQGFGRWWMAIFIVFVIVLLFYSSTVIRQRLKRAEQLKREETEKKLRETQQLFSKFINAAHVPLAMVNIDGTIEFLNKKCEELYGYSLEDIPNIEEWFAKAYPDHRVQEIVISAWQKRVTEAMAGKVAMSTEERTVRCKDGTLKEVEFSYTVVEDRVIITLNDKTEEKRILGEKKELGRKKAKAKKMEALGLLAGGVAHDLNNILSGVVSYPDLLLLKLPKDSDMRGPIELIQKSGRQAAAVVADLLTVARGVACVKKPENLNSLIDEYLNSPEYQAIAANHSKVVCRQELAAGLGNISCSGAHVKKCLMNLMTNGAEAIDGDGALTVSTRNETLDPAEAGKIGIAAGEYAVLSVRDTGGGIAEQDLEHIFDPFYTRKEMGRSGSGLGLTVVWNTMQDHDGVVTVNSNKLGTTFELYFPVSHEDVIAQEEKIDLASLQGHGESILVVDDQSHQRDIACEFLTHLNYACHAVASGEEALEYLDEHHADLVMLDMIMGSGMDGCQTYSALVAKNPNQKAIIASGFSENENVKEAQRLGAGDFIKKPYSIEQLGLAVKKTLAGPGSVQREGAG